MTHLAKNCVTMNKFMGKFYVGTDLSDVIGEELSRLNGKISRANFEKHQSVLKPSKISEYFFRDQSIMLENINIEKIKQKLPFHHNIPCLFQVNILK